MQLISAKMDSPFWPAVCALAREAFPPEEYLPPQQLIELARAEGFDFWLLEEDGEFIGFMVIMTHGRTAYLFFLAICPERRAKGCGAKALACLPKQYPDMQHVVDLEMQDDSAMNHDQRIARKAFYLQNGYQETGLYLTYLGVSYEVLCRDRNFDEASFRALLATLRIDGFAPQYFRLDTSGRRISV